MTRVMKNSGIIIGGNGLLCGNEEFSIFIEVAELEEVDVINVCSGQAGGKIDGIIKAEIKP